MKLFYLKIILLAGFLVLAGAVFVIAKEDPFSKLTYPIPELGNCKDKGACEDYCDKSENMKPCLDYAEAHSLLPKEEIDAARKMLALGITKGPGGCKGQAECESYCDDIKNIKECIAFGEKNNLIPLDELEEAKKVVQAIDKGLVPPKCGGKKECDIYCSRPENMEECIVFGEAAGLIPPDEIEEAKMMLEAIRKGAKPPTCGGKKECDIYCSQPQNMEECMTFAIAAGFMPPEEIENAKKMLEAIKRGIKPPNCQGKEECDIYCSQSEHMEECMEFGIAAGFIPPDEIEEAKMMLEAIRRGIKPPNCQGKEGCDIYCSQSEHMEECMTFAIAAGFMPPEEIENAKKMLEAIKKGVQPPNCRGEEECNVYCALPEHRLECINFAEAAGFMTAEDAVKARKMAEMGITGGPGGCQGEEACRAFCENPDNAETCLDFAVKMGEMTPEQAEEMRNNQATMQGAPGGCKNEEECRAYCEDPAHGKECLEFSVKQGMISPEEAQKMMEAAEIIPSMPSSGQDYSSSLPPEFQGKCASAQECLNYCLKNFTDPLCGSAINYLAPGESNNITPEIPEITEIPEGTTQPPAEETIIAPPETIQQPPAEIIPQPSIETIQPIDETAPPSPEAYFRLLLRLILASMVMSFIF